MRALEKWCVTKVAHCRTDMLKMCMNKLFAELSVYPFNTWHVCFRYNEDVHEDVLCQKILVDELTAFLT